MPRRRNVVDTRTSEFIQRRQIRHHPTRSLVSAVFGFNPIEGRSTRVRSGTVADIADMTNNAFNQLGIWERRVNRERRRQHLNPTNIGQIHMSLFANNMFVYVSPANMQRNFFTQTDGVEIWLQQIMDAITRVLNSNEQLQFRDFELHLNVIFLGAFHARAALQRRTRALDEKTPGLGQDPVLGASYCGWFSVALNILQRWDKTYWPEGLFDPNLLQQGNVWQYLRRNKIGRCRQLAQNMFKLIYGDDQVRSFL